MNAHLKAGIAIYNNGNFHAAHDAWEDQWLHLEKDTHDERFLHGLIQFTAAIYHATTGNWEGLQGLAISATEYLAPLPSPYRHVSIEPIHHYLSQLAIDPEYIERHSPPNITYDDSPLMINDLTLDEKFIVASVLAEEHDSFDAEIIETAIENAEQAIEANHSSQYIGLVSDFATDTDHRELIYDRLSSLISRQQQRDEDVTGLFEE